MSSKPPVSPQEPDFPDSLDLARGIDSLDQLSLERALLELAVVAGKKASDLRIEQCRLVKLDLLGAELVRASIADSVVEGGSWANVRTDRLRLNRVALKGVRMTGASLVSAVVEDVTFEDCRIDLAFFASARLRRVRFRKCNLDEVDFFGAALKSVAFDRCSLIRGRWTDSVLAQSEMRGCDLAGSIDLARLRGVRMPVEDVLANAEAFADALEIEILDRRTG